MDSSHGDPLDSDVAETEGEHREPVEKDEVSREPEPVAATEVSDEDPPGFRFLVAFIEGNYFYILSALLVIFGCYLQIRTVQSTDAGFGDTFRGLAILQGYELLVIATAILIVRRLGRLSDAFTLFIIEVVLLLDPTFFSNAFVSMANVPNLQTPVDVLWVNVGCLVLVPVKLGVLARFLHLRLAPQGFAAFLLAAAFIYLGEWPPNNILDSSWLSRYDYFYGLGACLLLVAAALPRLADFAAPSCGRCDFITDQQAYWLPRLLGLIAIGLAALHFLESLFVYLDYFLPLYLAPLLLSAAILVIHNTRPEDRHRRLYAMDILLAFALAFSLPDLNPHLGRILQDEILAMPRFVTSLAPLITAGLLAGGVYGYYAWRFRHRAALYRIALLVLLALVFGLVESGLFLQGVTSTRATMVEGLRWLMAHPLVWLIPAEGVLLFLAWRFQNPATWMAAGLLPLVLVFAGTKLEARDFVPEIVQVTGLVFLVCLHRFRGDLGVRVLILVVVVGIGLVSLAVDQTSGRIAFVIGEAAALVVAGLWVPERVYFGFGLAQAALLAAWFTRHLPGRVPPGVLTVLAGLGLFGVAVLVTFYKDRILAFLEDWRNRPRPTPSPPPGTGAPPAAGAAYRRNQHHLSVWLVLFITGGVALLVYAQIPHGSPVRARVATANAEMRNLAVALESYDIDHDQYPVPAAALSWEVTPTLEPLSGFVPRVLTTPIVYTSSLPDDPFCLDHPDLTIPASFSYRYAALPPTCWVLASNGPDGDADCDLHAWVTGENLGRPEGYFTHLGGPWPLYDPSNGTTSNGDILHWGP